MATAQKKTVLDEDTTTPSTVQPGDAPADTTDPTERASTVQPGDAPADTTDPTERASTVVPTPTSDEALAAGTVNSVQKLPTAEPAAASGKARIEKYKATKPDGTEIAVEHNLDTGETKLA